MTSDYVVSSCRFEQDGFTVIVERVFDQDKECETPEDAQANYLGESEEDKAEYFKQDKERYDAWSKGEWSYQGVVVRILKQTSSNWADGGLEVGRASLWGIESDAGDYFKQVEREVTEEAFDEVRKLKSVLCGAA